MLAVNFNRCFLWCRRAMKSMLKSGDERIVSMSSTAAHQCSLYTPVLSTATKSGIKRITKSLARTGTPLGIDLYATASEIIEAELLLRTYGKERVEKLASGIPIHLGNSRDLGLAIAFHCSAAAKYITGVTLNINGGFYFR